VIRFLDEIEDRCHKILGPTASTDDMDAFMVAAKSDIPALCRAVRAAVTPMECHNCGVYIPVSDVVARAFESPKEREQ
jgi:hypothetical protein